MFTGNSGLKATATSTACWRHIITEPAVHAGKARLQFGTAAMLLLIDNVFSELYAINTFAPSRLRDGAKVVKASNSK